MMEIQTKQIKDEINKSFGIEPRLLKNEIFQSGRSVKMHEIDYEAAEEESIKNGICPDCAEKINSKDCCCYSGD